MTPGEKARQDATDAAAALAVAIATRPMTWKEKREVDRAASGAVGLLAYWNRRERGLR